MPVKPQKPTIPGPPAWMNPAAKRLFSELCAIEIQWNRQISRSKSEQLADFICHRQRIDGLRKLMRSELRKRGNASQVLAVSREISSTIAAAHRLSEQLQLAHHEGDDS